MNSVYWAIDYVGDEECELILHDQLYETEAAAEAARQLLPEASSCEINWYSMPDLDEIYLGPVTIDLLLRVHPFPLST